MSIRARKEKHDTTSAGAHEAGSDGRSWTFITNHAAVLICIARDRDMRFRDIAEAVGITERAAQRIVAELIEAGYLTRHRVGRRNSYTIHLDAPMRHGVVRDMRIDEVLPVQPASKQRRRSSR